MSIVVLSFALFVHVFHWRFARDIMELEGAGEMPDRRAGGSIPHVGKQPRSRTKSGKWRKKRSDAGKKRPAQSWW